MNHRDVETLSSYLDGQLSPSDAARLESRLKSDEQLHRLMDDLRRTRGLLRQLPHRRAPHSFTLRAMNPKLTAPEPRAYPVLRVAGVLASFLFLASFVINAFVPSGVNRLTAASAPMPGAGADARVLPTAPVEALAQPFAAGPPNSAQTEIPPGSAPAPPSAVAPIQAAPKALSSPDEAPVPAIWQLMLGSAAVLLVWTAWYVRHTSARNFRRRWLDK